MTTVHKLMPCFRCFILRRRVCRTSVRRFADISSPPASFLVAGHDRICICHCVGETLIPLPTGPHLPPARRPVTHPVVAIDGLLDFDELICPLSRKTGKYCESSDRVLEDSSMKIPSGSENLVFDSSYVHLQD